MMSCRAAFAAGQSWNPIISEYLLKKGIPWSSESGLIDLIVRNDEEKKIILVEFKDTDLHSSLYGGKVNIKSEFGRMIAKATEYKLKGYLVECYCLYIQPKPVLEDLLQFMNDERTLMSICADFGIKPKSYGNKVNAAEFPFKRISEPWGVDLSIPLKCSDESPLLAKMLVQIDGVSPEKAKLWSEYFDHNLYKFGDAWADLIVGDCAVKEMSRFLDPMDYLFPANKDGTPSAQYSKLYAIFFDDSR